MDLLTVSHLVLAVRVKGKGNHLGRVCRSSMCHHSTAGSAGPTLLLKLALAAVLDITSDPVCDTLNTVASWTKNGAPPDRCRLKRISRQEKARANSPQSRIASQILTYPYHRQANSQLLRPRNHCRKRSRSLRTFP